MKRAPRGNCGLTHSCPFCFTRQVGQLLGDLQRNLRPAANHRGFLLLVATVGEDELCDSGIPHCHAFVRERLLPLMRHELKSRGCIGGLIALQVDPWQSSESTRGLKFRAAVLGERPISRELIRQLKCNSWGPIEIEGITIRQRLAVLNHLSDNSLRIVLGGHMAAYQGEQRLPNREGLFVWPSLTLATFKQWSDRHHMLAGRHLYDRWGSWVGTRGNTSPQLPMGRRVRNGQARSQSVFRRENNRRAAAADSHIDNLLAQHGAMLRQAARDAGKQLGRSMITALLASVGARVSDRTSRRLAARLRNLE